jgi:hypothetical protein
MDRADSDCEMMKNDRRPSGVFDSDPNFKQDKR